jgi:hypothetical protein
VLWKWRLVLRQPFPLVLGAPICNRAQPDRGVFTDFRSPDDRDVVLQVAAFKCTSRGDRIGLAERRERSQFADRRFRNFEWTTPGIVGHQRIERLACSKMPIHKPIRSRAGEGLDFTQWDPHR